ncbi:thiolase family protein [Thermodesulfobacteriota bacterium]
MAERVGIIGIGQTRGQKSREDVGEVELVNEAVRAALEDAEMTIKDIDCVVLGNMEFFEGTFYTDQWLVEGLGSYGKSGLKVNCAGDTGGSVFTTGVSHAASGLFNNVLIVAFEKQDEGAYGGIGMRDDDSFFDIAGASGAAIGAMWATSTAVLDRKSATHEHIARVRVKEAECGLRNPNAHLRLKLTEEDVLDSKMIVYPVRLLHVCPTSVASCAVIAAPEKEAKKRSRKPVWVKDYYTIHSGLTPRVSEPWLNLSAAYPTGPQFRWGVEQASLALYKRNGITNPREQLDLIESYSPSTWHEVDYYEALKLCEPGEAWKLIEEEATWPDGDIPYDLSGGVVSTNAIGATGLIRMSEAAIQIRGDGGEHQAPKDVNLAYAFAQGADQFCTAALLSKTL